MKATLISLAIGAFLVSAIPVHAADKQRKSAPDFTKGAQIPEGAKHDWNLGATGLRGWMFCDKMVTTDARQIAQPFQIRQHIALDHNQSPANDGHATQPSAISNEWFELN